MKLKKHIIRRKRVAWLLLTIFCLNLFMPAVSYALTSGPTQPETKGFQPASVSDMVDLQTGDFKYNIPLLDVDGYPININYQAGVGMEDEASWVGLGWSLNVGSINRQVRGVPDDMKGDPVETDQYTKPKITVGGRLRVKGEIGGSYSPIKGEGTFTMGVFNDNYTGMGAEIGVNPGISVSTGGDGGMTAGLGVGILSSTASGVDVTPYIDLGIKSSVDDHTSVNAGLSASLGYNTRSGMKTLSLGGSFGISAQKDMTHVEKSTTGGPDKLVDDGIGSGSSNYSLAGSSISYNTEPITPKVQFPYKTTYGSFSIDVGGAVYIVFIGGGGTGYKRVQEVQQKANFNPSYGLLYADKGKDQKNAIMDFIREKDNPVIPELPNLALPVQTPDLFTFSSQTGSGQFKLYRGGSGIFFDNEVSDINSETSVGLDLGFGSYFHGGATLFNQKGGTTTRKWTNNNNYLASGDFQDVDYTTPAKENAYFKLVGEKTQQDINMVNQLQGTTPISINLLRPYTWSTDVYAGDGTFAPSQLAKTTREPRRTVVSYLTANEAQWVGLDKTINVFPVNDAATFTPPPGHKPLPTTINRVSQYRQPHHFSEITVTDQQGKRMVYGLPVYNVKQAEYTFAIGSRTAATPDYNLVTGTTSQVQFALGQAESSLGQNKGIDNYFHKDLQPAYASSFLLTGILSPDYVDKTGNGISDDDLGTAIKFNYSKPYTSTYKWRTPYNNATLNKCLIADPADDKASIVYGEKELWYISSIESKTKIAYFITQNRQDGLGVTDFSGGMDSANPQKCLEEIRLYSKADMTKPIKVVKFVYDYSLCPGTPNSSAAGGGKLTLKKVYFQYGNTTKGQSFPYKFSYSTTLNANANVGYTPMNMDRWGVYKNAADNTVFSNFANDEFPYTAQDPNPSAPNPAIPASEAQAASLWHLNHIDLPTGGGIDVTYESDDYAYVQDKRAMVMTNVADLIDGNSLELGLTPTVGAPGLKAAAGVKIKVDPITISGDATAWFKSTYLNGSDYIYTKFWTQVSTTNSSSQGQDYDFIPCYSKIQSVTVKNNYAYVLLQPRTDGNATSQTTANPIIMSAWQKMKEEYPRYAYPGFDTRVGNETASQSVGNAVQAIFSAFANLSEITENFYHKAARLSYANNVQLNRSFVRIVKSDGHKLGGGVRVSKIVIKDDWNEMTGNPNKTYGQAYTYTTVDNGQTISSGVATYEPSVGNDENPLKQPVPYIQHIKGALDNFFDLEEPFGESFFPAPSVGYSKVTVTDLDQTLVADPTLQTGYSVDEFYTAKDYPVKVTINPMQRLQNQPKTKYSITETSSIDELFLSQGYAIELNDMHGKPKAERTFNQAGAEIASTVYYYNTNPTGTGGGQLNNSVNIVNQDGSVSQNQIIGRDIEFYTDFREQETINNGQTINIGADIVPAFGFPLPIPHWPQGDNSEYKLFRSACAVKLIQYYGIIDKVVKIQNGSSITTQNLAYDGLTGEPIVTQSQNEFNRQIYSVNIPAYWAYSSMGPSYQNLGTILSGLSTSSTGIMNTDYYSIMNGGDEFVELANGNHYWIVDEIVNISTGHPAYAPGTGGYIVGGIGGNLLTKFVVDRYGQMKTNYHPAYIKIIRSGARNMLTDDLTKIVCLTNPIVNNSGNNGLKLAIDNNDMTNLKVINASSKTYDENWSTEVPDIHANQVSTAYNFTVMAGGSTASNYNGAYLMNNTYYSHTFTDNDHIPGTLLSSAYFSSRLNRSSILDYYGALIGPTNANIMGFYGSFYAAAGTYFIGFDSNMNMSFAVDCGGWISYNSHEDPNKFGWNIVPVTFTTTGMHSVHIEMTYGGGAPAPTAFQGGAVEIYNNTVSDLQNLPASGVGLNIVWSTQSMINNPSNQVYVTVGGVTTPNLSYNDFANTAYNPCSTPKTSINPYIYGFSGNWRPYQTKVFQQNRVYNNILTPGNNVVDVKNAGYVGNFFSDWYPPTGSSFWTENSIYTSNWVTANNVTLYDKFGQELENKDALGRFSAAKFDFNGELPGAVVSNAKNREIYSNGLEDTRFAPGASTYFDPAASREFRSPSSGASINTYVTSLYSHSGNYSALLPAEGLQLSTIIYDGEQKTKAYLAFDSANQFIKNTTTPGLYPNGFEPTSGPYKKYIFDVWVKDGQPTNKNVNLTLTSNGASVPLTCRALVEDWKLLEGTIDLTTKLTDNTPLTLLMTPASGGTVYVDDIRIHPANSQMKSYAYDDTTMRIMAELDENGFATFYEYDSEGLLIRVKKETEKGIMTLKETRSSQKKNLIP